MPDRYPPGGCILRDKTICVVPRPACCDEGRAARWPDTTGIIEHDATTYEDLAAGHRRYVRPDGSTRLEPWEGP